MAKSLGERVHELSSSVATGGSEFSLPQAPFGAQPNPKFGSHITELGHALGTIAAHTAPAQKGKTIATRRMG